MRIVANLVAIGSTRHAWAYSTPVRHAQPAPKNGASGPGVMFGTVICSTSCWDYTGY
jgi:hypothetical protein